MGRGLSNSDREKHGLSIEDQFLAAVEDRHLLKIDKIYPDNWVIIIIFNPNQKS